MNEATIGFEPMNRGFADRSLRPLGYVATGAKFTGNRSPIQRQQPVGIIQKSGVMLENFLGEEMAKIYLKIVDIDQFQETQVTDDTKATHSVEVDDEEFTNVFDVFVKYLPKIQLHLPMDPSLTEGFQEG